MANRKALVLVETEEGCIVPTSHKLNADGYFRKRVWCGDELVSMMYHRYCWEHKHGPIPEGYEVDHKCKNRACCNTDHLHLLTHSAHRTKDNTGRHSDRKALALAAFEEDPTRTSTSIAECIGASVSAVCKWRKLINPQEINK